MRYGREEELPSANNIIVSKYIIMMHIVVVVVVAIGTSIRLKLLRLQLKTHKYYTKQSLSTPLLCDIIGIVWHIYCMAYILYGIYIVWYIYCMAYILLVYILYGIYIVGIYIVWHIYCMAYILLVYI